jgi:uncharacterized protein YhbP (UPF0306 family)
MERNFVRSRRIVAAAFDEESGIFEAEYFNGFVYQFDGVQSAVENRILQSEDFDKSYDALFAAKYDHHLIEKLLPVFRG